MNRVFVFASIALDRLRPGQSVRVSVAEVPFLPVLAIDSPDDYRLAQFPGSRFFFLFAFGYASADSVA
jgi:hypothetical protein